MLYLVLIQPAWVLLEFVLKFPPQMSGVQCFQKLCVFASTAAGGHTESCGTELLVFTGTVCCRKRGFKRLELVQKMMKLNLH